VTIVYFAHSLRSCWNHGNAHFLRGVLRALVVLGHEVRICEPADGFSLRNLLDDHGAAGLEPFARAYPELAPRLYATPGEAAALCDGADLVIVHEWNDPATVASVGRARLRENFTLLFHDTHHRAVSDPDAIRAFDLSCYDGVLAFGEALAAVYRRWGWGPRVFVWHEAADTTLFRPPAHPTERSGLVWIGNFGDGERTAELETFLLAPSQASAMRLTVHGVRYPPEGLALLGRYGAVYRGWLPNPRVPNVFAHHLATVHVPRRVYASRLPGIPTIRVFEALACGIPLVCAPWTDSESLFRPGRDYLVARDGAEMQRHFFALAHDAGLRESLARSGLETVLARHTCLHRARELLAIGETLSRTTLEATG
jgi:spore maturation protein CgeB